MTETLLTLDEAQARLSCSRSMLYKLARKDELCIVKMSGAARIPASSLDAYMARVIAAPLYRKSA